MTTDHRVTGVAAPRALPVPPELLFVVSGIFQYLGASIAVHLFEELPPTTVTLFRVLFGALPILVLSSRSRRPWTRTEFTAAAVFGLATAAMNLSFYLAIDRLPLGKSVVIEFQIGRAHV